MSLWRHCDGSGVFRVPWGQLTSGCVAGSLLQSDWFWISKTHVTTSWGRGIRVRCVSPDYRSYQICLSYSSLESQILATVSHLWIFVFLNCDQGWPWTNYSEKHGVPLAFISFALPPQFSPKQHSLSHPWFFKTQEESDKFIQTRYKRYLRG